MKCPLAGSQNIGSREKAITLLLKTWVRVPRALVTTRNEALSLLRNVRRGDRLPFHWGMTMAAYPFWRVVADVTGRLFRLQGTVASLQVQRRAKELLGERQVVARSTRHVLRAFADWGVIDDSSKKGEYSPAPPIQITDLKVAVWITRGSCPLNAGDFGTSVDFGSLIKGPSQSPFQIASIRPEQLTESGHFEIVRHGLEDVLVRARPSGGRRLNNRDLGTKAKSPQS